MDVSNLEERFVVPVSTKIAAAAADAAVLCVQANADNYDTSLASKVKNNYDTLLALWQAARSVAVVADHVRHCLDVRLRRPHVRHLVLPPK